MTARRFFLMIALIVVCNVIAVSLLGYVLGLGIDLSGNSRDVFRAGDDPGFRPVAAGLRGMVVGSVTVLCMALCNRREKKSPAVVDEDFAPAPRRWPSSGKVLVVLGTFITIGVFGSVLFVAGALVGQTQLYQQRTNAKLARIEPILKEPRFAGIVADFSSAAQVYLTGSVPSEEVREALGTRMRSLFGEEEAHFVMLHVEVAR